MPRIVQLNVEVSPVDNREKRKEKRPITYPTASAIFGAEVGVDKK